MLRSTHLVLVTDHGALGKGGPCANRLPVAHSQARTKCLVLGEVVVVTDGGAGAEHAALAEDVLVPKRVASAKLAVLAKHVVVAERVARRERCVGRVHAIFPSLHLLLRHEHIRK